MTANVRVARIALAPILIALFMLAACRKDAPLAPTPVPRDPTLQTIWPNDDGRAWTYEQTSRSWVDPFAGVWYATVTDVPPAPSLADIVALLGTQPIGSDVVTQPSSYQLKFAGPLSSLSGATGQNLTERVIRPGPQRVSAGGDAGDGVFFARLLRARPDLRPVLAARMRSLAADTSDYGDAIFLHGYVWRKTASWIGTYGDLDTLPAWKYLTSNLAAGTEFHLQLIPSVVNDIWLHARILARGDVTTPAGTWKDAVVCLYLVDFGVSSGSDSDGYPNGYSRMYEYGTVTYVDGVGPVACYDRQLVNIAPGSVGLGDVTLALTATTPTMLSDLSR